MAERNQSDVEAPLAGIRILDFTRVLAGPFCSALLADIGAEVIKVEPAQGDEYRHIGPFRDGESALFLLVNRNKKSIVLDLKQPEAQAIARDLAGRCDVVLENFRPGVTKRLGIDYAALSAANPRLVYASISGFGQAGPLSDRPAFDLVAQAMSEIMDVTGEPDGPPMRVGESLGDLTAGLYAAWAVSAALYARERTGRGGLVDVAMFDALFSLLPTAVAQWMFGDAPPRRVGNRHPISTPFGAFRARDGHLIIAVLNSAQFARLADALGRPELAEDPRFATDESRTRHEPMLRELIEDWLADMEVEHAVGLLADKGVPASPIWTVTQAIESAQVAARGLLTSQMHPRLGPVPGMEQPVHFAGHLRGRQAPAPALGADTEPVLRGLLGYGSDRIAALRQSGAIGCSTS